MIELFFQTEFAKTPERLDTLWKGEDFFVLLPEPNPDLARWLGKSFKEIPEDVSRNRFGVLSSGTEGRPKLLIGDKTRARALSKEIHKAQDLDPVEQTIAFLPVTYSYAFVNQWVWAETFRKKFFLPKEENRFEDLRDLLSASENAMICLVGAQVPLLKNFFPKDVFPGVIRLNFAGGRFPQESLPFLRGLFPKAVIYNNFGCVEALPRLTIRKAEESDNPSFVGRPLPGIDIRSNPDGFLEFKSPFGAIGALDEKGFLLFSDQEWILTGDKGSVDSNKNVILEGRTGEVFKRYGEKISLFSLAQSVQNAWPGQVQFYRQKDKMGEEGHILVLSPHPTEDQAQGILDVFRTQFKRSFWPLRIESVDAFPILPNGKVDAKELASLSNKKTHWSQMI